MLRTRDDRPAALLACARRITIKIGSSLLIDDAGVRLTWLAGLASDIAALRHDGKQVAVTSSGAVALGRRVLGLTHTSRLELKQAAAAAGQPLLMQAWAHALAPHGIAVAQLLLTYHDTEQRTRWLNAYATFATLLAHGALPIVNENDTVAIEELRYGDNDRLSAHAAQLIDGDLLILLSDVDGLFTADPARDPTARHIATVDAITPEIEGYAGGARTDGLGTGGMATKIVAAAMACGSGCATIIASGRIERPLSALTDGARATVFPVEAAPTDMLIARDGLLLR